MPGALCPQVVKELRRRHYSLMINFPHTLPLPDLSKQGRAEEQEAEGGEKAGEESLGYSDCTLTLQLIPKQLQEGNTPPGGTGKGANQGQDRHAHTLVSGWQRTSPCACSPPCSANPRSTLPHAPIAPSKLIAMTEGRSSPFMPVPVAASSHTTCSLTQTYQQLQFPEVLLDWGVVPVQRVQHWHQNQPEEGRARAVVAPCPLSPPLLAGRHTARGKRLCDPQAQAASRSLPGQPKEFCHPETNWSQRLKTQPKGLTCCFPRSTSSQEVPKNCVSFSICAPL